MVSRMVAFCDRHPSGDDERLSVSTETYEADGRERELDLCEECLTEFKAFLEQVIEWSQVGREIKPPPRRRMRSEQALSSAPDPADDDDVEGPSPSSSRSRDSESVAIREWAIANGHQAATRGRLSREVREAYREHLAAEAHARWNRHAGESDDPTEAPLDPAAVAAVAAEAAEREPDARPMPPPAPRLMPPPAVIAGRLASVTTHFPPRPPQGDPQHG